MNDLVMRKGILAFTGPNQDTSGSLSSWNSAHASASRADTAPRGGAGRLYCFAR